MDFDAHYELALLDFADDTLAERRSGFVQAASEGFHQSRPKDETERLWIELTVAEEARVLGVWRRPGHYGAGPRPVATYASFAGTLNAGAGPVPLWMVTDVTVSPAHRRRGLLRRMMTEDLVHAVDAGFPLAGLTASEATIYGRFGFGPATSDTTVWVDTSAGFALRERSSRPVELVEASAVGDVVEADFAGFHATTRGSVSRPLFYGPLLRGEWHPETGEPDHRLRGAVTIGPDGEPDGHVLYRIEEIEGVRTLHVVDQIARCPEADLALWQLLGEVDLVDRVQIERPVQDPLRWALADRRRLSVKKAGDHVWLRILDPVAVSSARTSSRRPASAGASGPTTSRLHPGAPRIASIIAKRPRLVRTSPM